MILTQKAQATRNRILDAGAELFHLHGYNATGLDKIIKSAEITKGNFYYHFKSKEALAVATLESQLELIKQEIKNNVLKSSNSPLENIFELLQFLTNKQKVQHDDGHIRGCYFGNFTLELSTSSSDVRLKLKDVFYSYLSLIESLLVQAKETEEIASHIDPKTMSSIIMSQVEGAILLDKAKQEPKNLDISIEFIMQVLTADLA